VSENVVEKVVNNELDMTAGLISGVKNFAVTKGVDIFQAIIIFSIGYMICCWLRGVVRRLLARSNVEPLVSEEMWERCQQILASRSARVIDENGKKHKYMRNTPKSVWTAKLRCSCGAGFIQFKWRVNRDGAGSGT